LLAVKVLEDWRARQGLYVPTAQERAETIERLLEMEGLVS